MSERTAAPEGPDGAGDKPVVTEIRPSGKKGIPVLIQPFLSDERTGALSPAVQSAFRGLLIVDVEEEDESPAARKKRWLAEMRGWLMVLATLAASVTYSAGLNPPGGFWQADDPARGYVAGNPVMRNTIPKRFQTFHYLNATAFVTSLVIIVLLMNENFYHKEGKLVALELTVVLDLMSLMGAYITGSTRSVSSSIYVIVLAAVVLAYVINIARVLPDLCFLLLWKVPKLDKVLPATDKIKDRVKAARKAEADAKEKAMEEEKKAAGAGGKTLCACCGKGQRQADVESN